MLLKMEVKIMTLKQKNDRLFATLLVSYVGLIIFAVFLIHGLVYFYEIIPHAPVIEEPVVDVSSLYPKPCENFVFTASMVILFLVASLWIFFLSKRPLKEHGFSIDSRWMVCLIVILTALALYSFQAPDFVIAVMNHHGYAFFGGSVLLVALLWRIDFFKGSARAKKVCVVLFLSLFVMITLSFRLLTINTTPLGGATDLDVPIYPISQVLVGKFLFVDFPEQYGGYAAILSPIFHLFGVHSLFGVTLTFSVLLLLALCALVYILYQEIRVTSVFLLCGLTLIFFNTNAFGWALRGYLDPYYQYNPIRFFWPCIAVLIFYFYAKKPVLGLSVAYSILSGIALIWNVDSGVPVAGAFLVFLLLQLLYRQENRSVLLLKIVLHIGVIGVCLLGFFGLTFLISGGPLHYEWLFKYQRIFYVMGLDMMPLPLRLHPWMLVVALYLFGIIFPQFYWRKGRLQAQFANLIFYLSVLGLGLFMYYTGRSYISNLLSVLWPALLIAALLVDHVLGLVERRGMHKSVLILTLPFWMFVLMASLNQVSLLPRLVAGTEYFLRHIHQAEHPVIVNELAFIQHYKGTNSACVILSQRQGIYSLEAGLANPISGPGVREIMLEKDRDHLLNRLLKDPVNCLFYGVGTSAIPAELGINLNDLLVRYMIKAQNSAGTLFFLVPKTR
jgi:hypothetical protein